jgi:hypothetical protein
LHLLWRSIVPSNVKNLSEHQVVILLMGVWATVGGGISHESLKNKNVCIKRAGGHIEWLNAKHEKKST